MERVTLRCACGLLMLALFGLVPLQAQPSRAVGITAASSHALLESGRTQLLTFTLYGAERSFRQLARASDGEAAARYHLALTSLLKAVVTDEAVYFDELTARSDSLMDVLERQPAATWRTYLEAEAHFLRAMALMKADAFLKAALSARQAYKHYEDVLEADPTFYEAYVGLGLMHIMIGTAPGPYRGVLKLLGYGGSLPQGLRELRLAAEHNALNREEAMLYRSLVDIMLNGSKDNGVDVIRSLQASYPQSALFNHLYGYALLQNRRADRALPFLQTAVRAGGRADYFYIDYSDFYLAQAAFRLGRWAEAEQHYRRYLKRHRGTALKALATLELGQSLEMQNRRSDAVAVYRRVRATRSYDSDQAAFRKAQRLLVAPMTKAAQTVLKGRNAYLAGQYEQGAAWLASVKDDRSVAAALRMEATYHLGRLYQAQGQMEQALASYEDVTEQPEGDNKARWIPWSHYFIGEIYAGQGASQRARRSFEEALDFNGDYDYRQSLEQQAQAALARL